MSWNDLTTNQWVSYTDAQGSPFPKIDVVPTSDEFMNKTEVLSHLGVSPSSLSGLSDNQFITKSDLTAAERVTAWRPVYPYCIQNDAPTYYNVERSGVFTRNNCTGGQQGTQVTYTVAASTYSSTISQQDADDKAWQDVLNNGQSYANSNGSCFLPVYFNVQKSATATKNDCGGGYTGSEATYIVAAGRFNSHISQSDADNHAQAWADMNVQDWANSQGHCTLSHPPVSCGAGKTFEGGEAFPAIYMITLGSGTGTVDLNFSMYNIPDKMIVEYNGVTVIDTGYRGTASFYQQALDKALYDKGLPTETVNSAISGTLSFTKTTAYPTTATVRIYSPLPGTAWQFVLSCPH